MKFSVYLVLAIHGHHFEKMDLIAYVFHVTHTLYNIKLTTFSNFKLCH